MATKLPKKSNIAARVTEEARRMDSSVNGVALEALVCREELEAEGHSPSEAFTEYGYGLRVVKAVKADQERIVNELKTKPSKDVVDGVLKVSEVQAKHPDIEEFVEPAPDGKEAPIVIEG